MALDLDTLDVPRARRNGVFQIINGGLCIFFNAAIFIFMAASRDYLFETQESAGGIWGGVFYIASGALIFACGRRQSLCLGISALTINVIAIIPNLVHIVYMSLSVMGDDRRRFVSTSGGRWDGQDYVRIFWRKPIYVVLFSVSMILAYVQLLLLIWAVFILSEAFYWRHFTQKTGAAVKVDSTDAAVNDLPADAAPAAAALKSGESSFNHALATVAIKANAIFHAIIAVLSCTTNIAVIAVFVWGIDREYEHLSQTNGFAIFTAPFFVVLAYFGFTAGQTGSNKRLVTFLVLSVLCGLLSFLEGGGATYAIFTSEWEMTKWIRKCTTKPDWHGRNRTSCDWVMASNPNEFKPTLITLNAVIILFAVVHLALCIWGVIIASKALHKDEACYTCFKNCMCCEVGSNGCGGGCEGDCCLAEPRGVREGAVYQPIQFVVSHQGTTTLPNGQQALVVLLPMNGNMSVQTDGDKEGAATVTVNNGPGVPSMVAT